jgi:mannosyltransferase
MLATCLRSWHTQIILATIILLSLFNLWHSNPGRWADRVVPSRFSTKRPTSSPPHTPTSDAYSAVFLYLASIHPVALDNLVKSLDLLDRNLPTRRPWPIIIFHTGDYDEIPSRRLLIDNLQARIGNGTRYANLVARLEYEKLDWKLPPGISNDVKVVDPVFAARWPGQIPC